MTARQDLVALVGGTEPFVPGLRVATGSRRAAVLMLFGVLDDAASRRDAHHAAVHPDLDVLLLARAPTLRAHAGEIAFPGGRIDPGDADATAAALREAREETGLDPAGVDVLGTLADVPLAFSRHLVTPVVGWWRERSAVRVVDQAESAEVFRVPVADLVDPAARGVTVMPRDREERGEGSGGGSGSGEWRGPAFLVRTPGGERTVWGFTAMLLDAVLDRTGWAEPWDRDRVVPLPRAAGGR